MSVTTRRPATPEDLQNDLWLGGGLLVAGIISGWLGQVVGFFGDDAAAPIWSIA